MAKTCRTCAAHFMIHSCEELDSDWAGGRLYWERPIDDETECPRWRAHPEPLLADVLGEALQAMLTLPYRPLRSSSQQASRIDMIEAKAKAAVSRYKEEVCDAEAVT